MGRDNNQQEGSMEENMHMQLVEALLNLKYAEEERDTWKAEALELRERMGKIRRLLESYERAGAK